MPIVWIPALLRDLTGGQDTVTVPGTTVGQIVENLDTRYPGVRDRLCAGEGLKPGMAVAVGTQVARLGLLERVAEDSEIHFLPAIAGGV